MNRFCHIFLYVSVLILVSCIKNDIPYPVVTLDILGVQGEGFTCETSDIDQKTRVVTLHLEEQTNIKQVEISKLEITEGGSSSITVPGTFDLSAELPVTLSLYQDYEWTIRAEQEIERIFTVESQIGAATFDVEHHTATVHVPEGTDMDNIKITALKLGPADITTMTPDPSEITSFENYRTIDITYHGETERWSLYVIPTEVTAQFSRVDVWTRIIWLYGEGRSGTDLGFRYRKQGTTDWITVPTEKVEVTGGAFKTCLSGLEPETSYELVAYSDTDESPVTTVTTEAERALPNGGFEEWCTENDIVYPGVTRDEAFWGTGNTGAAVVKETLTDKTSDKRPGSDGQYAALLQSKLAGLAGIGKLAAGNLFVGEYVATRGTNGIVGFGRPFTQRPTALRGWVKYNCGAITDVGTSQPTGVTINKGDPDNGMIYVAVGTWTPEEYGVCEKETTGDKMLGTDEVPICVDTRDKNTFFNPNSPAVIAYGELVLDKTVADWQQFTIKLKYNETNLVPTHLVLVISASRYGDYYIGSRDSKMWVDDFELVYDEVTE